MYRILIVDDHVAVTAGLKFILENEKDFQVKAVNTGEEALDLIKYDKFDIYIVDLNMPEINGLELTKKLIELNPFSKIIIYTGCELELHFHDLLKAGVLGFLSKTDSESKIINTIRSLLNNNVIIPIHLLKRLRYDLLELKNKNMNILTAKELHIIEQVAQRKTNIEIADTIFLSTRTVEYHLTNIFKKLKVNSRKEAVDKAKEWDIINSHF